MRRYAASAGSLLTILLAFETGLVLASRRRPPLVVDIGPTLTGPGWGESLEYDRITARSPKGRAVVDLPVSAESGPGTIELRYARLGAAALHVFVRVSGREAEDFWTPPGRWTFGEWFRPGREGTPFTQMHTARVPVHVPSGRVRIVLETEGLTARDDFALPVDWIRLEGVSARMPIRLAPWPRLLIAGVFMLILGARGPLVGAVLAGVILAAAQVAAAALDPVALAHVAARVTLPALVLGTAVAWAFRCAAGLWKLVAIFLAGYLLKGAGIFHPAHRQPDVLSHSRYVAAFKTASGSLYERGAQAQVEAGVGLRPISGRRRPHPYSPLFYLPFTWAGDRLAVEEAMKHAALFAVAADVVLAFVLATRVFGPPAGLWAALLAAFLPILHTRLILVMFPALAGHFFDTLAVVAAATLAVEPSRRRLAGWLGASLLSALTYITGLFNLAAFALAWAAVSRRRAMVPAALALLLAIAATTALYAPFLPIFVREVVPMLGGENPPHAQTGRLAGVAFGFYRFVIHYGWLYPVLVVAGLLLGRRQAKPEIFQVLAAHGLAVAALVVLRGLSLGVMQDLKEMEFAAVLVATTAGGALAWLAARGRAGAMAAAALAIALVAFGLARYEISRRANLSSSHDLVLTHQQTVRPAGPLRGHVLPAQSR